MLQNIAQYFTNVWDATVAFLVSNAPLACLAIVAGAIVGVVVVLHVIHLERIKEMCSSEEIGELAQTMWEEYQQKTALEPGMSIVGKDCPACHMFLEEGHVCPDEDELGPEAEQAMNAFHRMQASEPTWQERERRADFERFAYCGWEEI
jgi:hypothetical protein